MPRYMMSLIEDQSAYDADGALAFETVMAMRRDFADTVRKTGATIVSGEALQGMSTATFLRGTRTEGVSKVPNPSPEVIETLGGYYLLDVADDEQAEELAELCPAPYGYVELRPIWDLP